MRRRSFYRRRAGPVPRRRLPARAQAVRRRGDATSCCSYAKNDQALLAGAAGRKDATGQITKLTLWNQAGDDLYGMFSRSPRIVDRMEQLLGGEVYHYHTKMMLKEPRVGGAWEWHQDYGYWYHNGCLFPLLASCLIAVDRATRQNGCLQVLSGSHQMGRIEHGKTGDQTGADMEMVDAAHRAAGAGLRRGRAGRRPVLPLQPAAPLGPEPLARSALVADLLLQRGPQQPLQGIAPSALLAAGQGRGHGDQGVAADGDLAGRVVRHMIDRQRSAQTRSRQQGRTDRRRSQRSLAGASGW